MKRITPCLWFESEAEDAARFYCSIFRNSRITQIEHYSDEAAQASGQPRGSVMTVMFELNGQEFMGLNGGPQFQFNEAVSFMAMCESQEEVDRCWNALCGPGSGGQEVQCGWLKDRFGVSWQIVPTAFMELMQKGDAAAKGRVMSALMGMTKLDIAAMRRAFDER